MDDLRAILDQLEGRELDYVYERSRQKSDAAAYKAAGIGKSTFYEWDKARRDQLNEWAQELKRATTLRAVRMLEDSAEIAATRVVSLLLSMDDAVALRAAKDILDRSLGRAKQSVDLTSGGEPIERDDAIREDILRQLSRIASSDETNGPPGQPDD